MAQSWDYSSGFFLSSWLAQRLWYFESYPYYLNVAFHKVEVHAGAYLDKVKSRQLKFVERYDYLPK